MIVFQEITENSSKEEECKVSRANSSPIKLYRVEEIDNVEEPIEFI